ncbi:host attachment protein [Loktanella sp. 5RATIMAR09]|uniref:baeRF12 domain-containing protein n=1 Tax=Loktanella sp. 5RATIMAR09 TaxID=1225655 RepID=UPI0006EBD3E9|nr:host attachment protein [Loktanella sp. 5RATIMAR09]
MKPHKTWIVLADSKHVRIAVNDGPGKGIYGRSTKGLEAPPVTELSDAPGMTTAPVGPNRGNISDPDFKGLAAAAFAADIVSHLAAALDQDEFERLVLVASPAMLGILRKSLTPKVKSALRAELPKDLTHIPLTELPDHLSEIMLV